MIKKYTYKQPLSIVLIGVIGIACSILFASMIELQELWISIIFGVLTLLFGSIGCLCIYTFYINLGTSDLQISSHAIELPIPRKKHIKISFEDIDKVEVISNPQGKLIEIYTKNEEVYLIDQKWMKKKDFIEVSNRLNEWK
ncbi:hypothetical protein [uncultured Dokdonia sp.]|uniref:hypothetical protein n=1 Tax=uncultured Dokdonia sp. TaxID=575653 RepID=UPI0026081F40|nr:hypothetical protein [uncultured Dokdonia sp.]